MTLLKKIPAAFLLFLGTLPSLYSILFLAQQFYIQHEMLEKLEQQHLQAITIAKKDFSWHKKGKEIKTGDELFDVKEWKEINGYIILRGMYDKEEKQLNQHLSEMMNSSRQESPSQQSFAKLFTQLISITNNLQWEFRSAEAPEGKKYLHFDTKLLLAIKPVFTPPPRA